MTRNGQLTPSVRSSTNFYSLNLFSTALRSVLDELTKAFEPWDFDRFAEAPDAKKPDR